MCENITLPEGARFENGIYAQIMRRPVGKVPALFLDRDGAVVVESHYLHRVEDVALIAGASATIAKANRCGIAVVFVTNQAGVGYGYFGWDAFLAVQERILGDLADDGAHVDAVFACPFHARGKPPYDHPDHPARKPNPGMLTMAAKALNLDLPRSWIVGDRAGDLEAGRNAGIAGGVHVLTGHGSRDGERDRAMALGNDRFRAVPAPSIAEAADFMDLLSP